MKNLLPLFAFAPLISGCFTYQYVSISSTNGIPENEKKEFVAESDSLQIVYNFKGNDLPVSISIMNKLDKEVMVDWSRSSLVINGGAVSFVPEEVKTTGSAVTTGAVLARTWPVSYTDFSSTTVVPANGQLIPPKSFITRKTLTLSKDFIKFAVSDSVQYTKTKRHLQDGRTLNVKEVEFTEANSPLKFRCYLTLLVKEDEKMVPLPVDNAFYVSRMIRAGTYTGDPSIGHSHIMRMSNGGNVILGVVSAVVVTGVAIAAFNDKDDKDNK